MREQKLKNKKFKLIIFPMIICAILVLIPILSIWHVYSAGAPTISFFYSTRYAGDPAQSELYCHEYRNGTLQTNTWIYIRCGASDPDGISKVWVAWYNGSTYNIFMTYNATLTKYEVTITGQDYALCTFTLYANDTLGNTASQVWDYMDNQAFASSGPGTEQKYVGLGQTPDSNALSYKAFYFQNGTYYTLANREWFPHEQAVDGGYQDTGLMYSTYPTQNNYRYCLSFVGFYLDDSLCIPTTAITNLYEHVWWASDNDYLSYGCYKQIQQQEDNVMDGLFGYAYGYQSKCNITYPGTYHTNFHLLAAYYNCPDETLTSNKVNTFVVKYSTSSEHPEVVSTPSYASFVICNLPSNGTLASLDSDSDGLNDFQELYTYYTNPFRADTDNGGVDDGTEVGLGKNPLVPIDDGGDTTAPTYSNIGYTNTLYGSSCTFSCKWTDNVGLSGYIFSWNGTQAPATWTNYSWTVLYGNPAWANKTLTLPYLTPTWDAGILGFRWYCNDPSGNMAATPIQTLQLSINHQPPWYSSIGYSDTVAGHSCVFSCYWQDNVPLSYYLFSWNGTAMGSWANSSWIALGNTFGWSNYTATLPDTPFWTMVLPQVIKLASNFTAKMRTTISLLRRLTRFI
jgi:hypothetical protein